MKYANHYNYITKVRQTLLGAGTQGLSQHDLNQKTRTKVFQKDDMLAILYEWEGRDWVQRFKVTGISRHPKTMWRATTRLRDEWSSLQLDGELPTQADGSEFPEIV